ncbi:MAG: FixH family protein [Rhizobiaceae bacterium]
MNPTSAGTRQFTGWHMLGVLVLFFGTIITVNVILAVFATNSWTGLVVRNSYVAGQTFNEENEKARKQAALGLRGNLELSNGELVFQLNTREGEPVALQAASIALGRPSNESQDHTVELTSAGHGRWSASSDLAAGIWQAKLVATMPDGTAWKLEQRLAVAESQTR